LTKEAPVTAAHYGKNPRPGVFICYRRQDSAEAALRVYRLLSEALGDDRVFMDLTIPAGEDFVEWIKKKIGAAGVVIPVIGPTWLAVDSTTGRRRIDDPKDILRNEITGPLERGLAMLPVLAGGAQMPGEDELPPDLARLARINALELRTDAFFQISDERLVQRVTDLLGETKSSQLSELSELSQPSQPTPPPPRVPASVIATGLSGVALLAVGLVLLWDRYITPDFPSLPVEPGVFTALAPLGILGGALLAVTRVSSERKAGWLDVGLLAGFGFAAAAKGVSLLGESEGRVKGGGLIWVAGGVLVGAAGVVAAVHLSKRASMQREYGGGAAAFVAVLGAAMLIVGAVIPFNVATPGGKRIVASDSWLGADPIGIALAVLVAVAFVFAGRRRLAAGLLLALGFSGALLWVRYIGIPVAQWTHTDGVASPRLGGLIGLAGGVLVFGAGWRLATSRQIDVSATAPLPTTNP
jgi:TIR domain